MHYDSIDTNWDDPSGWATYTTSFLNRLHPVTANLVEEAVRVRHCYKYPIVEQFILRADAHIRTLLATSHNHNPAHFRVGNYSPEDYAKIADYVKNLVHIFSTYYDTNNGSKELESLKCVDMSVGNLSDFLSRVESAVDRKLSPLAGIEGVKRDISNLLFEMDCLENSEDNALRSKAQQKSASENIVKVLGVSDTFANPRELFPPPELQTIECGVRVDCPGYKAMQNLVNKLRTIHGVNATSVQAEGKIQLYIFPSALETSDTLSVAAIMDIIATLKRFLSQNGCKEFGFFHDDHNWKFADWRMLQSLQEDRS